MRIRRLNGGMEPLFFLAWTDDGRISALDITEPIGYYGRGIRGIAWGIAGMSKRTRGQIARLYLRIILRPLLDLMFPRPHNAPGRPRKRAP